MSILRRVERELKSEVRAFTLLDGLLTLMVTSFVIVSLAISINHIFAQVETKLFFADFEQLYLETQQLSVTQEETGHLLLTESSISSDHRQLSLPDTVSFEGQQTLVFDGKGGNSTFAKLVFYTEDKEITYQLYLGSGKYKKTENKRLYPS